MSLTKYEPGSMRELCHLSFPLMISSLSVMLMVFVDRLMLAHYSTEAFNAVVNASTFGWAILNGWMILASISEVFVAQYNGANDCKKIGEPVWQMIWLSAASILFFFPSAIFIGDWVYGTGPEAKMLNDYLQWMMFFGPTYVLYGGLVGFFVGRGEIKIITILAVISNLVNAVLDYILIFGIENVTPSFGIEGAAIATCSSQIFQVIVLGLVFLNKENRKIYHTHNYSFMPSAFWKCLKIGFPGALFGGMEVLGWALFYMMMASVGTKHITIAGVSQTLIILFYFWGEGISKAAATICGNMIGAKRHHLVNKVLIAGTYLHLSLFAFLPFIFYFFSDYIAEQFLNTPGALISEDFKDTLRISLIVITFYLFFEGIRLLFTGIFTAAGDTFFLMLGGSLSIWVLLVLPIYLIVVKSGASIEVAQMIMLFYGSGACVLYAWRFFSGNWKKIQVISN